MSGKLITQAGKLLRTAAAKLAAGLGCCCDPPPDSDIPCAVCLDRVPKYLDMVINDVQICACRTTMSANSWKRNSGGVNGTYRLTHIGSRYDWGSPMDCVWHLVRDDLLSMSHFTSSDCTTGTETPLPYTHIIFGLSASSPTTMIATVWMSQSESPTDPFTAKSVDLFCTLAATQPADGVGGCENLESPRACDGYAVVHYNRTDSTCDDTSHAGHHGYAAVAMV